MTGQCLRCVNNTAGDSCEKCSEWYYGDAIDLKDCQSKSRGILVEGGHRDYIQYTTRMSKLSYEI